MEIQFQKVIFLFKGVRDIRSEIMSKVLKIIYNEPIFNKTFLCIHTDQPSKVYILIHEIIPEEYLH